MTDLRKAAQQALDVLIRASSYYDTYPEIAALEAALAEQDAEPVAWRTFDGEGGYDYRDYELNENYDKEWAERNPNHAHWVEPLYIKEHK